MMMKKTAYLVSALLFALAIPFAAACTEGEPAKPDHLGYKIDKSNMFGIVEPLHVSQVQGFHVGTTIELMKMLGVKSYRFQVFLNPVANTPENPNSTADDSVVNLFKSILSQLRAAGIEHIIMEATLKPYGYQGDGSAVPERDSAEYGQYLLDLQKCWKIFVEQFPEITYWEMGNEPNMDVFMHKYDFVQNGTNLHGGTGTFTMSEKVDITTDLMYYASKGIHEANPKAIAVMPGLSCGPQGMASRELEYFIDDIYTNIGSGNFPYGENKSKSSDDYFQVLAWHPYLIGTTSLGESWLNQNDRVYDVVKAHGDDGKKVFITELGFSDAGLSDRDEIQAEYFEAAYDFALNRMPYVETIHAFRLYECEYAATWGGAVEIYFGFFKEGDGFFIPKAKAYTIQEIFGGTGDLAKYAPR